MGDTMRDTTRERVRRLRAVARGRGTRGSAVWTRCVEVVLFATALLAVGLALLRLDVVSDAPHEASLEVQPSNVFPLPRLNEAVAGVLAGSERRPPPRHAEE
jgi:hypothetical protein